MVKIDGNEMVLSDPKRWPGHEYVWDVFRQQWVSFSDYALVEIALLRETRETLGSYREEFVGSELFTTLAKKYVELRRSIEAVDGKTPEQIRECSTYGSCVAATQPRALELADKLMQTEAKLREVRADRDELREQLEERKRG